MSKGAGLVGVLLCLSFAACRARERARPAPEAVRADASLDATAGALAIDASDASIFRYSTVRLDRETHEIIVDGVVETWTLRFATLPEAVPFDVACPEEFHLFGERGDLSLVRARPGAPDEVLPLGPFFTEQDGVATVARYPAASTDFPTFDLRAVEKRPEVVLMQFADYDHDGRATEFLLPVASGSACGRLAAIAIGVGKTGALHALTTVEAPTTPLTFYHSTAAWPVLARAPARTWVEADAIRCGDHGANIEATTEVMWDAAGIHTRTAEYLCVGFSRGRKLLAGEVAPRP